MNPCSDASYLPILEACTLFDVSALALETDHAAVGDGTAEVCFWSRRKLTTGDVISSVALIFSSGNFHYSADRKAVLETAN